MLSSRIDVACVYQHKRTKMNEFERLCERRQFMWSSCTLGPMGQIERTNTQGTGRGEQKLMDGWRAGIRGLQRTEKKHGSKVIG